MDKGGVGASELGGPCILTCTGAGVGIPDIVGQDQMPVSQVTWAVDPDFENRPSWPPEQDACVNHLAGEDGESESDGHRGQFCNGESGSPHPPPHEQRVPCS